jgi:hypothetical protein
MTAHLTSNVRPHDADMVRLCSLTAQGDTGAARHLLVAAQRLDDDPTCMVACRVLVAGGEWEDPLAYYERRVETLTRGRKCLFCTRGLANLIVGGECQHLYGPIDCHELVNAGRRLGSSDAPRRRVQKLQVSGLRLWYPSGWMRWLGAQPGWTYGRLVQERVVYTDHYHSTGGVAIAEDGIIQGDLHAGRLIPIVPECVCLDAGMERGRCPGVSSASHGDWLCYGGSVDSMYGPNGWDKCPTCSGTGLCPRCGE